MVNVTDSLLNFANDTNYDDLPAPILHEVKRGLLDSIGSVFAGLGTEKGKMALSVVNRLGGAPEASVIGTTLKTSLTQAAMVNGELMYSLDFDTVPHLSPFVLPPVLSVTETLRPSGKELIAALAVGQEAARRINNSMNVLLSKIGKGGTSPDVFGNSNEHMLGGSLGLGKLMRLDRDALGNALGIAGYLCSVPTGRDWEDTIPKSIIKYAPAGWNCNASVMAVLLAQEGYTGSVTMLDNRYGFHKFYGAGMWEPERIVDRLGEHWEFPDCQYKLYPSCRFLQSALDCVQELLDTHHFKPQEITSIDAFSLPFYAHPDQYNVTTQIDAQYSFPYAATQMVFGVKPGVDWQDMNHINNEEYQAYMKRIRIHGDPRAGEEKKKDPASWYARVEMVVNGETFCSETLYSKGTNIEGHRLSDTDLIRKFEHNALRIITQPKTRKAIDLIMHLEELDDASVLFKEITL
ncbi:MAG: MmgE/PrpD family protein [Peptoniphilaceae bacterium]|jgi:2-methylcitrate dehydratase PrpD